MPFEVHLARSGQTFLVPADQSVAEVLKAAGIPVGLQCGSGVCGACVCRVLEGQIDHRDHVLTQAERTAGDHFAPCVSRAHSSQLVLDL